MKTSYVESRLQGKIYKTDIRYDLGPAGETFGVALLCHLCKMLGGRKTSNYHVIHWTGLDEWNSYRKAHPNSLRFPDNVGSVTPGYRFVFRIWGPEGFFEVGPVLFGHHETREHWNKGQWTAANEVQSRWQASTGTNLEVAPLANIEPE